MSFMAATTLLSFNKQTRYLSVQIVQILVFFLNPHYASEFLNIQNIM